MSKRDLFVIIYCCIWGIIGILGVTITHFSDNLDEDWFIIFYNIAFLWITASFVCIKPISKWVDKNIIERLP